MAIRVEPATQAEAQLFCDNLREFNTGHIGKYEYVPLWLSAKDDTGKIIGGLVAEYSLGWLTVSTLWVAENCRRCGIGSQLLAEAERAAIAAGCHSAWLDTYQWQARDFYIARGYHSFGQLPDFPTGHNRHYMSKRLNRSTWTWPDSLDALVAAPKHHTLLLENEHVRVLDTRVLPGETTPVHTHRWPSILYVLSWGEFVRRDGDGKVMLDTRVTPTEVKPGNALWYAPLPPHSLENVGMTEIHVVALEMKDAAG